MQLPAASGPQQSSPEPTGAARSCGRATSSEAKGPWLLFLQGCEALGGRVLPSVSRPHLPVVESHRACFPALLRSSSETVHAEPFTQGLAHTQGRLSLH